MLSIMVKFDPTHIGVAVSRCDADLLLQPYLKVAGMKNIYVYFYDRQISYYVTPAPCQCLQGKT